MSADPAGADGLDLLWLAVDGAGHLGAFVTAGQGPIPSSALPAALGEPWLEGELSALPLRGAATLLVKNGDMSSWTRLAERGLYAFDWQDVHRSSKQSRHSYDLVALPPQPLRVEALPARLAAIARVTPLALVFADCAASGVVIY